jgi:hypothetical protein
MKNELLIREMFRVASGVTVFACEGILPADGVAGKKVSLVSGQNVPQEILLLGDRHLLNPSANQSQIALETQDTVNLTPGEARSGLWALAWC